MDKLLELDSTSYKGLHDWVNMHWNGSRRGMMLKLNAWWFPRANTSNKDCPVLTPVSPKQGETSQPNFLGWRPAAEAKVTLDVLRVLYGVVTLWWGGSERSDDLTLFPVGRVPWWLAVVPPPRSLCHLLRYELSPRFLISDVALLPCPRTRNWSPPMKGKSKEGELGRGRRRLIVRNRKDFLLARSRSRTVVPKCHATLWVCSPHSYPAG